LLETKHPDTGDMTTTDTTPDLDRIGLTIDRAGLAAVPASLLDDLVLTARRHQLRPVATSILADPRAPTVVRERAFGLVASAIGTIARTPTERSAA
jgi:hypothetical protein